MSLHERLVRDEELEEKGHERHAMVHNVLRLLDEGRLGYFLLIKDQYPVEESDEDLHGEGDLEEDGEPLPGSEGTILVA
eukprot:CAMPEP_0168609600 /NCGR_PEP_ID=MMETSP0449_2-20121227/1300_1 /TAXON_ID=1082188 /ORGANISM="Strombidium rassoulzadegani, Strain ras09" /LENGTH=78 /DNA_ID=CAMNT_0008649769 /DNA_START=705 /DNA_END=941 /DNA_ORIENTATION=-